MIKALVKQLGLDKLGDVLAEEVQRVQVEVLQEERALLAKLLGQIEERIRGLGGKRRGRPPMVASRTRKPRPKRIARAPGETLQFFVLRAFRQARHPIQVSEIVNRVRALGHQTAAHPQNLLLRLYRVLSDKNLYKKVGTGLYALALPRAPRARTVPTARKPPRRKRATPVLSSTEAKARVATPEVPAVKAR